MARLNRAITVIGMLAVLGLGNGLLCANEQELKDPTKPYKYSRTTSVSRAKTKPIVLNYIKRSGGKSVAYLNGTAVQEGDRFRGMTVKKVGSSGVQLVSSTQRLWVPLLSTSGITKK